MRSFEKSNITKVLVFLAGFVLLLLPLYYGKSLGIYKSFFENFDFYQLCSKYDLFSREYLLYKSFLYPPVAKILIYLVKDSSNVFELLYSIDFLCLVLIYAIVVLMQWNKSTKRFTCYTVALLALAWFEVFQAPGLMLGFKLIIIGVLLVSYAYDLKPKVLCYITVLIGIVLGFSVYLCIPFIISFFKKERRVLSAIVGLPLLFVFLGLLVLSKDSIDLNMEHIRFIITNTFVPTRFFEIKMIHRIGTLLFLAYVGLWAMILVLFVVKKRSSLSLSVIAIFALYIGFTFLENSSTLNSRFIGPISVISLMVLLPEILDVFAEAKKMNLYNDDKFCFSWVRVILFTFLVAFAYLGFANYEPYPENLSSATFSTILREDPKDDYIQDYNRDAFGNYYFYVKKTNPSAIPNLDYLTAEEGYYPYSGFYGYDDFNKCYWTKSEAVLITYSKTSDYLMLNLGCPEAFIGKPYHIYVNNVLVEESNFAGEIWRIYQVEAGHTIVRLETEGTISGGDVRAMGFMIKDMHLESTSTMEDDEIRSLYGLAYDECLGGYWINGLSMFLANIVNTSVLTFEMGSVPRFTGNEYVIIVNGEEVYKDTFKDYRYTITLPFDTPGDYLIQILSEPVFSEEDPRIIAGPLMSYKVNTVTSLKDMNSAIKLGGMAEKDNNEYWSNGNAAMLLHHETDNLYLRFFVPTETVGGYLKVIVNEKEIHEIPSLENEMYEITMDVSEFGEILMVEIESTSFIQPLNNERYSVILCQCSFVEVPAE